MNPKIDECWTEHGRLYVPDLEIKEANPEHNYIPLRGYGFNLAVMDKNNTCLGWIKTDTLGFISAQDYLKENPDRSFYCNQCFKVKTVSKDSLGTGYAVTDERDKRKACYDCCATTDRVHMRNTGKITLYLSSKMEGYAQYSVTNWPGTLKFPCFSYKKGIHNIGGSRIDVWFDGPDGFVWWGVHYGYNHQLVRCKRTKKRVKANAA